MGKGNRNRNDRYEDIYSMSGSGAAVKPAKSGAKKDNTTTLLVAVIAVILLVAVAIFIFSDSGVMERNTVYVSSDNFEVTGTMLPYYENLAYMNTFEQYYYLYYNYYYSGDAAQAYNAVAQMMSGYTLNDFFDSAITSSKELVALAEEALANGVKLEAEDLEEIETTLKDISAGSLGTGVKKKDVKAALELQALAVKYVETVNEAIEAGATDEALLAFVNEHKADYYTADMLKYAMTLKAEDFGEDGTGYTAAERLLDEYAEKLAAATSVDEFKKTVIEYEVEKALGNLIADNLGTLAAPSEELVATAKAALIDNLFAAVVGGETFNSGVTDDATYAEVFETAAAKLYATCTSAIANLPTTQTYTEAADDEVIAWVSNSETKEGDTKIAENKTEEEYTKTVYIVEKAMHLDEAETKDVAHILIKADEKTATAEEKAAAKAKAEKILADFLAGEATLEKFEELAATNNEDSNCVYKGVTKGRMVAAFDAWTFDESRKTGDTAVVETEYGYHVMYFIGEGRIAYQAAALSSYTNDEYTKIIEELTKKYVTVNEKAVAKNTKEDTTKAA